jgi:hypothetical protein
MLRGAQRHSQPRLSARGGERSLALRVLSRPLGPFLSPHSSEWGRASLRIRRSASSRFVDFFSTLDLASEAPPPVRRSLSRPPSRWGAHSKDVRVALKGRFREFLLDLRPLGRSALPSSSCSAFAGPSGVGARILRMGGRRSRAGRAILRQVSKRNQSCDLEETHLASRGRRAEFAGGRRGWHFFSLPEASVLHPWAVGGPQGSESRRPS